MTHLSTVQRAALTYLQLQQRSDGAFLGEASPSEADFTTVKTHYTTFCTSLITSALSRTPGASVICAPAAGFLLSQKSADWTWNYWIKDSPDYKRRPYPNDLDDTAVALTAITQTKAELLPPSALAAVAKSLISQETAPGGPYTTWLVSPQADPVWRDIDIAVNANIGMFLDCQGVHMAALEKYLTTAITNGQLVSRYYNGITPVLYLISRWYQGSARSQLADLVVSELAKPEQTALSLSLLLSAGCSLAVEHTTLSQAADNLLELCQTDHWPAAALYFEPIEHGQAYWAGSAALTTALALEALQWHSQVVAPSMPPAIATAKKTALAAEQWPLPTSSLIKQYQAVLGSLLRDNSRAEITSLASTTATACRLPVPAALINDLDMGGLHGWMAYRLYDNILDHDHSAATPATTISLANLAGRRSLRHFRRALPLADFENLVETVFDDMDAANDWEINQARAPRRGNLLEVLELPVYASYRQLAAKSWGHTLAARGTLLALGYPLNGPEQTRLQAFFHHYLIARQLNDDAHDWQIDIEAGQLSSVVTLLLQSYAPTTPQKIDLKRELTNMQSVFWNDTFPVVAGLIDKHLRAARAALAKCSFMPNKAPYEDWLDKLALATNLARSGRRDSLAFIAEFNSSND